jgi:hypothetical protein
VYELISSLRPYFFSLREIDRNVSLDIKIPGRWNIENVQYIATQYKRRKGRRIDITPGSYYDSKGQPLKINCEFRVSETDKKAWVYSTTTIPTGSELFISYGDDYWK